MSATHSEDALDRLTHALTDAGSHPRRNGSGWIARCPNPGHGKGRGDRNPSLSVSEGKDGNAVLFCQAGCHTDDVLAALNLTTADLFSGEKASRDRGNVYPLRSFTLPPRPIQTETTEDCTEAECANARRKAGQGHACANRYTYTDAEGNAVGVVHRWDPKTFRPCTPDENGAWHMRGSIPAVPYALPRVLQTLAAGGRVVIVEGEKDADALNAYGLAEICATTNAAGAGKWRTEHTRALASVASRGEILLCGDDDTAGREHVAKVLQTFAEVGLPSPVVVYPTRGKDLAEHLENGGTLNVGEPDGLSEPWEPTRLGKVLTLADLEDLPPIRHGIEGWTSSPSAVLLVGAYGLGKSALTLSMACSVASGTPFLGHNVEHRRVLYVVGEGARGLPRRVQAWRQIWGRDLEEEDLLFMTRPSGSLRDDATWRDLRRYCRSEGIGWVCLDTFSSLAPEADETKDAALVVSGLNALAEEIDGTAILVHHPGWSQSAKDRARGGYQLEGNVDEVLTLDAVTEGSDHISAKVKKRKDGESGQVHYLRRIAVHLTGPDGKPLHDDEGLPVTSVTVQHANVSDTAVPVRERVLQYLAACGEIGATPKEIAGQIGVTDPADKSFRRALNALTHEGDIRAEGSTSRRRYYTDTEDE